jgi:hypothetical protein
MTEDDERSENERWYDAEISPTLFELGRKCEVRGISFFSAVEYDKDCRAQTRIIPNKSLAMVMLTICCSSGTNLDGYVISLLRYCRENGIDVSQTMIARMLDRKD